MCALIIDCFDLAKNKTGTYFIMALILASNILRDLHDSVFNVYKNDTLGVVGKGSNWVKR